MFGIGDFAGLGRVSVRMLRHYDAIGLLRPAHVDPGSGYRYYAARQLRTLNRIVALKGLGFTLQQVQAMLDDKVDSRELRGMLRLRRTELAARVEQDHQRLAQVDARLRLIESEGHMDTGDVLVKAVPARRLAVLSATALGYDHPASIGENLAPLYPALRELLLRAGVATSGPPVAYYLPAPAGPGDETVRVHAGFPVGDDEPPPDPGFDVVVLPPVPHAATAVHLGSMHEGFRTGQKIATWIDDNDYRTVPPGFAVEVYLDCPPREPGRWVTELQVPVEPAADNPQAGRHAAE